MITIVFHSIVHLWRQIRDIDSGSPQLIIDTHYLFTTLSCHYNSGRSIHCVMILVRLCHCDQSTGTKRQCWYTVVNVSRYCLKL